MGEIILKYLGEFSWVLGDVELSQSSASMSSIAIICSAPWPVRTHPVPSFPCARCGRSRSSCKPSHVTPPCGTSPDVVVPACDKT